MLRKIVSHELRLLRKDKTVWVVVVCFALVIGYAVLNRSAEVETQKNNIKEWPRINERSIHKHQDAAREIERKIQAGEYKDETPPPYNARSPRYAANNLTATIALPPAPLAVLAVGRSDLDTLAYRANLNSPPEPRREQTDYPLKLLIGRLDLAFVTLYLYPLFILALSFNLISSEKESGVLALLLSQPISARMLIFGKTLARAIVIFGSTILFSAGAALFSKVNFTDGAVIAGLLLWLLVILIYGVFWFGLAVLANYRSAGSAPCALLLTLGWFGLTILLPASINLVSTSVFPAPSRTEFINARRGIELEIQQQGEEKFDLRTRQFLAEHPEFPPDYHYDKPALTWMDTAQRHIETSRRMRPINDRFDGQLKRQRLLTKYFSIISPLTVMRDLLPEIAGTGRLRYQSYLAQINDFHRRWNEFFWTKTFFQTPMSSSDYDLIPRFKFLESTWTGCLKENSVQLSALTIQTIFVVCAGLGFSRKLTVAG